MSDQELPQPQITINEAHMAGVYANFAVVGHSQYEFTLDFARLDFGQVPPQGVVVARVSVSPLFVSQLIDALNTNWARYVERTMPPEVTGYGQGRSEQPGEEGGEQADD